MKNLKEQIQNEIEAVWPQTQKNLEKINKNVSKLLKDSEKNLKKFYNQTKKKTEEVIARAKREELYYELGKKVSPLLTSDQLQDKDILRISTEIQKLCKKLRSR